MENLNSQEQIELQQRLEKRQMRDFMAVRRGAPFPLLIYSPWSGDFVLKRTVRCTRSWSTNAFTTVSMTSLRRQSQIGRKAVCLDVGQCHPPLRTSNEADKNSGIKT